MKHIKVSQRFGSYKTGFGCHCNSTPNKCDSLNPSEHKTDDTSNQTSPLAKLDTNGKFAIGKRLLYLHFILVVLFQ